MDKQTIEFSVEKSDSILTRTGKSYILHPEIRFSGGSIRWHQDRTKQQHGNKNG